MGVKKVISTLNGVYVKYNTTDPFKLCEYLGYEIKYKDYNIDGMKGYYTKIGHRVIIYLNSNLSILAQSIVCAHEIGHALMHECAGNYFGSENMQLEYEANLFAACLVLENENYDMQFINMNGYLLEQVIKPLIY